ncbi:hypothetical protein QYE76_069652 [Lolium multiflorum]|uniref:DUF4218 domain-containing protein n=1 Tax=Lolium multiflorum TaxID=4521 RepID=A0AAD8SGR8_LOLMU|nr:hypothetical protein QYE76_069652 [Lolium multiflorum]
MWKKKSIFWELEYWKVLDVRSAIDVMHVTKNICVNLLSFLGVYGKTNDTKEARQDQQRLKDPDDRHPEWFQGRASYALTKEEKVIFFECLSSMKVPSGFSSNIKGIINMADKKFQNLKSHDCHVIMTQLLPIALRGLLPENVRVAIVKLCAFLNAISQKVINPEDLPRLQNDVVQCLVSFELVFPPSFFNIMTHLLVHLVEEISILGPVFLHNMFPFERFMGVLKKYVRNRARPEGSIAKGYGNEEVIEFCVDYVPDLKPIGLPRSRHEGRLSGKGTIGRKSTICMDGHSMTEAHHTVLTNSSLVAPYFEEHKNILRSDNPGKPESWIRKAHMETFGSWLRKHLMNDNDVGDQLYMLAKTPSSTITTFQGYEINGNTFYTIAQDKKSTNQNSGVRFDSATESGQKEPVEEEIDEPESSLDEKEEEIDEPESSLDEKEEESDEQKEEEWISYPCQPSNESNSSSLTLFDCPPCLPKEVECYVPVDSLEIFPISKTCENNYAAVIYDNPCYFDKSYDNALFVPDVEMHDSCSGNILGIGRNQRQTSYFPEASRTPKEVGGERGHHTLGPRGPSPPPVWGHPVAPLRRLFAYLSPFDLKMQYHLTKLQKDWAPPPSRNSNGDKSLFPPAGRGSASEAISINATASIMLRE